MSGSSHGSMHLSGSQQFVYVPATNTMMVPGAQAQPQPQPQQQIVFPQGGQYIPVMQSQPQQVAAVSPPILVPPPQGGQFVFVPNSAPPFVQQSPTMAFATAMPSVHHQQQLQQPHQQFVYPAQPAVHSPEAPLNSLFQVVGGASAATPVVSTMGKSNGGESGKHNSTTSAKDASTSSINSDTPCRHYLEGKCNRRKCRFRHDSQASNSSPHLRSSSSADVATKGVTSD